MCEPMSWIEYDGEIYFITAKDLRTKDGRELKKYLGSQFARDVVGHGAIDHFFGLKGQGKQYEVNDFTDPGRFPQKIVDAIKAGAFRGMFICPQILRDAAWAEYEKVCASAWAEYEKVCDAAWAEYEKVCAPARAEYEKVCAPARAEYEKVCDAAWAEYEKVCDATFWRMASKPENRGPARIPGRW